MQNSHEAHKKTLRIKEVKAWTLVQLVQQILVCFFLLPLISWKDMSRLITLSIWLGIMLKQDILGGRKL